jgi:hypothetical protein
MMSYYIMAAAGGKLKKGAVADAGAVRSFISGSEPFAPIFDRILSKACLRRARVQDSPNTQDINQNA